MSKQLVSAHSPYIPINVQVKGKIKNFEALIDTGFDGNVVIPRYELMNGELPAGYLPCKLADGSKIAAPFYEGIIKIGKLPSLNIIILAIGDECLIGRGVTDKFKVIFDHGRKVIIKA